MRITFRRVAILILVIYLLITCYTGFMLLHKKIADVDALQEKDKTPEQDVKEMRWNPWGFEFEGQQNVVHPAEQPQLTWQNQSADSTDPQHGDKIVEIWGKAAIGLYLWEHIFQGHLEERMGGIWSYGALRDKNIIFRFRTGPGVVQDKVPDDVQHLILVLNGREPSKIETAISWLTHLDHLHYLKNVGVVLLGDEKCDNSWIHRYLNKFGGPVKFVFLTYDSPEVDDDVFFQWPLGVATYRLFPLVKRTDIEVETEREYTCNFLGTIYKNSSREHLLAVMKAAKLDNTCYMQPRMEWLPNETDETREDYVHALAQSDLTLNPVGQNTECYRVYEAMAFGSVPVVENKMTPGKCGDSKHLRHSPLRLLKQYGAPIIYVKSWSELPNIIQDEMERTLEEVIKRRKNLLMWFEGFKEKMKDKFIRVVRQKFFGL